MLGATAISIGAASVGYYLLNKPAQKPSESQKYLVISTSDNGTTNPPPGTYLKNLNEQVGIQALPSEGYEIGTWVVDGVELGNQPQINLTMDLNHTVIVTFWLIGQGPPPSYPVSIMPLQSIMAFANYGAVTIPSGFGALNPRVSVHVNSENWVWDQIAKYPMQFKVTDPAGKGVPNLQVDLWAGMLPDPTKYKGLILLNEVIHVSSQPLRLVTDSEGVVTVYVSYKCGLDDKLKALCYDAEMAMWLGVLIVPTFRKLIYDGYQSPAGTYLVAVEGGGETGKTPQFGSLWPNEVYAQVVGASLVTVGRVMSGFRIKWV